MIAFHPTKVGSAHLPPKWRDEPTPRRRAHHPGTALLPALAFSLAAIAPSYGFGDPAAKGDGPRVTIAGTSERDFPEITLDFQVKNTAGAPILDAARGEFRVTEYGDPVEITKFTSPISKETRPTTVVLVLDRSGSMNKEERIVGLKKAVASFLASLPKGSRMAVVAFGTDVSLICPFTADVERVAKSVNALQAEGNTRYYDAVTAAIQLLSEQTGRRAVLAMTDGEDNLSMASNLESTIRDARREGIPVHTLGLGSEDEIEGDALAILAEQTRGQPFSARQADELGAIFEEIARGLGESYSLTYRTNRKLQDGTLRPIRVFYSHAQSAGEAEVYIPGMVVPAAGWSPLFLAILAGLVAMAVAPGWLARKAAR